MSASSAGVEVRRLLNASPERVFAAFADEVLVPRGSSTELTIRHAKLGRADADIRHEEGWRGALDLLEARLE